jgi:hypothetical protein
MGSQNLYDQQKKVFKTFLLFYFDVTFEVTKKSIYEEVHAATKWGGGKYIF